MWWRSSRANKLPALERIGAVKRASASVYALFFAALLIPINAQQFASKLGSLGSSRGQLIALLGIPIGVDSVWAAATNNNRIHRSRVAENNDDQWNSLSVRLDQPASFRIEYSQLPAFASLQVDQICSYCYTVY